MAPSAEEIRMVFRLADEQAKEIERLRAELKEAAEVMRLHAQHLDRVADFLSAPKKLPGPDA